MGDWDPEGPVGQIVQTMANPKKRCHPQDISQGWFQLQHKSHCDAGNIEGNWERDRLPAAPAVRLLWRVPFSTCICIGYRRLPICGAPVTAAPHRRAGLSLGQPRQQGPRILSCT